ncbi:DUF502 family protein [Halobacterium hubeiense]|jgi:uncharacterized membrane protein|uniref:DUF502 family protein n=2 Tax=Halobacterium TaxID=2239 RepID=A0A0U5H4Z0_9EURY|nr:DUF502 domain-containing protein [Halobacterium hubeiense]CQH61260.1 DUF502 family protein [Halobacterium hubeiense]
MTSWKRDFASGLIVLAPILVTLYVLYWLFSLIARFSLLATNVDDPVVAVSMTVVIFVLLVFSVGYLMRTALGTFAEEVLDDLINRLPGLRIVYNASKMAVETVLSGGADEFQKPVKVEPWEGMRLTAFKTGKTTDDGREVVFMPTAPNITSGFVMELEPEDVIEVDESTEDALTRVLSAGFGENERDVPEPFVDDEDEPEQ